MISAINLAQRQAITPRIQKQNGVKQNQTNSVNVNFTGKPNKPAMAVIGILSTAFLVGGSAELVNIISNLQSIKVGDGVHIFESFIGILFGGGMGFAAFQAFINEGPKIAFESDKFLKKVKNVKLT